MSAEVTTWGERRNEGISHPIAGLRPRLRPRWECIAAVGIYVSSNNRLNSSVAERPACDDGVVPGSIPGLAFAFSSYSSCIENLATFGRRRPKARFMETGKNGRHIMAWHNPNTVRPAVPWPGSTPCAEIFYNESSRPHHLLSHDPF